MPTTKDFVPISQIKEDTVILTDGSIAMIIQTSAVNFDLLSEGEQLAIIGSFAALLNSLSFSIQILIRSKKLDISHYLSTLKEAERKQTNPLLQLMMQHYRAFVSAIIRDNEVLDKQFYVIIAVSPIELGVVKSSDIDKSLEKAITILGPRRDHILKQLARIGLKSEQLNNEKLIKLFYDIYNDDDRVSLNDAQENLANKPAPPTLPEKKPLINTQPTTPPPAPKPKPSSPIAPPPPAVAQPPLQPAPISPPQPQPLPAPPVPAPTAAPVAPAQPPTTPSQQPQRPSLYAAPAPSRAAPFVVEELPA